MPVRPGIEGLDIPGVHELHSMEDSFRVKALLERADAKSAVIVGSGFIGVEMADALTHLSMKVTLVELGPVVFPSVDPEFGSLIEDKLRARGVAVVTETELGDDSNAARPTCPRSGPELRIDTRENHRPNSTSVTLMLRCQRIGHFNSIEEPDPTSTCRLASARSSNAFTRNKSPCCEARCTPGMSSPQFGAARAPHGFREPVVCEPLGGTFRSAHRYCFLPTRRFRPGPAVTAYFRSLSKTVRCARLPVGVSPLGRTADRKY